MFAEAASVAGAKKKGLPGRKSFLFGASVLTAFTLMNPNKTKFKPNEVGSILKGGAAERARPDFFQNE